MSNRIVVLKVRACSYGIGEDKCAIVWCDSSILSVRTFYGYVHPQPLWKWLDKELPSDAKLSLVSIRPLISSAAHDNQLVRDRG